MLEGSRRQVAEETGRSDALTPVLTRLSTQACAFAIAAATLLGCGRGSDGQDWTAAPQFGVVLEDTVVPEAYKMLGEARRAGAESPSGFWIAAPGVGRPERVLVENLETGATAEAALFRSPDGGMRVSEEVATSIGMSARPSEVRVTAIRTEARIAD